MKKFFVIGNPIEHSLSPELHNFWIKKNKIDAVYDKIELKGIEIRLIIRTDLPSHTKKFRLAKQTANDIVLLKVEIVATKTLHSRYHAGVVLSQTVVPTAHDKMFSDINSPWKYA